MKWDTKYLTKASLIAAMYVVLVLIQLFPAASLLYANVQIRLAEGLAVLPLVEAAAVPGVFVGCVLSNLILMAYSGFGAIDVVCGSLVTLAAALLTRRAKRRWVGFLSPILLNGCIVSIWVSYLMHVPYAITALTITVGEALSVGIFGSLILYVYDHSKVFRRF